MALSLRQFLRLQSSPDFGTPISLKRFIQDPDEAIDKKRVLEMGEARYRLERELGGGTFNRVYLASLLGPDGEVLPGSFVIRVSEARWRDRVEGFERSAHLRQDLEGEAGMDVLTRVLAFKRIKVGGRERFVSVQPNEGKDLKAHLEEERERHPGFQPLAYHWGIEAARGVSVELLRFAFASQARRSSVVHRDIKPDNVCCTVNDVPFFGDLRGFRTVRLSDLDGLCSQTSATFSRSTTFSSAYAAPECSGPRPWNNSSMMDVYAVGAVVTDVLTFDPQANEEEGYEAYREKALALREEALEAAEAHAPDSVRPIIVGFRGLVDELCAEVPGDRPVRMAQVSDYIPPSNWWMRLQDARPRHVDFGARQVRGS